MMNKSATLVSTNTTYFSLVCKQFEIVKHHFCCQIASGATAPPAPPLDTPLDTPLTNKTVHACQINNEALCLYNREPLDLSPLVIILHSRKYLLRYLLSLKDTVVLHIFYIYIVLILVFNFLKSD